MKKIAFIGCSYTAYHHDNIYENSWTYQLYRKFPQHTYYNYALGGHGPAYFRWCILDAKARNVDAVFLTTTHAGRDSYLLDSTHTDNQFKFIEHKITENYITPRLHNNNYDWISATRVKNNTTSRVNSKDFFKQYAMNVSMSDMLESYNIEWYRNSIQLYNFEKIWLLDFRHMSPAFFYHHPNKTVWDVLKDICFEKDDNNLYKHDICISEHDDHWTHYGNSLVLDHYVLTENVKKYLESY